MKKLSISKEISFPPDVVTQTLATIGRKGAGKTYLATMIAEQILDIGAQVVAIDPVGNWWGLRVGSDGRSKGKQIFVMGGEHGDVPIVPEAGAKVAKVIVEKGISVILDISGFRLGERKRFCADFGEELLHLKKKQRTPVHIFIEEAQLIIPQRVGPEEARMVGAFEQIVRLGRNYGIGCTLVTQRPQSVNKEVLSQVECLCVLQVTGLHERKALEDWVQEAGADRSLIGELPGLEQGEGYVWSPSWLRIYQRVHFAKKQTFDASATPKVGQATRAASLSAVDVKALKEDMAEVVSQAQKDDPIALRKEIAELRKHKCPVVQQNPVKIKSITIPVVGKKTLIGLQTTQQRFTKAIKDLKEYVLIAEGQFNKFSKELEKVTSMPPSQAKLVDGTHDHGDIDMSKHYPERFKLPVSAHINAKAEEITSVSGEPTNISSSQQRILDALAWMELLGRSPSDKTQIAILSEQRPTSGGYFNSLGGLRTAGMITYPTPGMVALTDNGRSLAKPSDIPRTSEQLQEMLFRKLSKAQIAILKILIEIYPEQISKDELAERAGLKSTSGGYFNNLGRLRSLKLIDYPTPGFAQALPVLFL